jgi:hypothetical protein
MDPTSVTATAGCRQPTPAVPPEEGLLIMTKPASTEKVVPITVGNPSSIASFIIDQSHMEEFTKAEEEKSSTAKSERPPKGTYFTVPKAEKDKPNSLYVFLLEMPGRETYLVTPETAKKHSDEDVIRPVLLVRYVTMLGEEGLWPVKLDAPDQKPNTWNTSAKRIVEKATGAWVRIISKQKNGQYRYVESPIKIEEEEPKFSDRTIHDLIESAYDEDHRVSNDEHEVWTLLAEGKAK